LGHLLTWTTQRAELARLTGDEATCQCELREAHRLFTEIGADPRSGSREGVRPVNCLDHQAVHRESDTGYLKDAKTLLEELS